MPKRVVVMSDIHGNLPALEAVDASLPNSDMVIVAGDHCLEGAAPAEVLDLLYQRGWTLLVGNTDRDITVPSDDLDEDEAAQVAWTREQLGEERLRALRTLEFGARVEGEGGDSLLAVHANPLNLEDQLYPTLSEEELRPYVEAAGTGILAFGHLHIPYVRPVTGTIAKETSMAKPFFIMAQFVNRAALIYYIVIFLYILKIDKTINQFY